jgi:hypothetical protein
MLIMNVGIEIEARNSAKSFLRNLTPPGWRLVEDGSCRSHSHVLGGTLRTSKPVFRQVKCGGEFVSPILDTENDERWKDQVRQLLSALKSTGEGVNAQTGIHVHVHTGDLPAEIIKNILEVGLYLEAGFYRLACGEVGRHRGELRADYGYCRPLLSPPVVHDRKGHLRKVFDAEKIINNLESSKNLAKSLGNYSGARYHEARYVWLNLLSLFTQETTELRLFNSTLTPKYLFTWVELSKKLVRSAFWKKGTERLPRNPLGTDNLTLDELIEWLDPAPQYIPTMQELWELPRRFPRGVHGHQRGHLGHTYRFRNCPESLRPEIIDPDNTFGFDEFTREENLQLIPGYANLTII